MGQSVPYPMPRLSGDALDALSREVKDAAEHMSDEQVLCLADALHDALRTRRRLRTRSHDRVEQRMCENAAPFPF